MIAPSLSLLTGLVLGSFFNVLVWRIPRGESIAWPSSHCPDCGRSLRPWHNIPVASFLILGGKCSSCRRSISIRYPLTELAAGGAALILWYRLVETQITSPATIVPVLFLQVTFLLLLIPISMIDFRHYIIPDGFTLPLLCTAAAMAFFPGGLTPVDALLGVLAGGGSLFAIGWIGSRIMKKDAMGGGDIKLMAAAGALWGPKTALLAILFGSLSGSVYGIVTMSLRKAKSDHQIPFGPFLGGGIWIAALFGGEILKMYLIYVDTMAGSGQFPH